MTRTPVKPASDGPLFGRRLAAITIDWLACLAISAGFLGGDPWATLGIFALENTLFISVLGRTLGQQLLSLRVTRDDRAPFVGVPRAIGRTLLLCLFIPAVVWDDEGRGMHDRLVATRIRLA